MIKWKIAAKMWEKFIYFSFCNAFDCSVFSLFSLNTIVIEKEEHAFRKTATIIRHAYKHFTHTSHRHEELSCKKMIMLFDTLIHLIRIYFIRLRTWISFSQATNITLQKGKRTEMRHTTFPYPFFSSKKRYYTIRVIHDEWTTI